MPHAHLLDGNSSKLKDVAPMPVSDVFVEASLLTPFFVPGICQKKQLILHEKEVIKTRTPQCGWCKHSNDDPAC